MRDLLLGLQLHLSLKLNFTEILSLLHSTVDSHMSPIQAGKEMFRYTSGVAFASSIYYLRFIILEPLKILLIL
jgi:hypothetical protein